ncbi:hypothetical protein SEVIR_3G010201v4 [Setaria viridis]|uniref:Uncharacterized protein n=1 Tax=Setaria viridis TaxID=4556 RepID=A0A4U6V3S8_SETVI|nr:hypothetical protein SEVIR_3G010201v2 [Setaria viridis]TKW23791.1 hypothetical protein SEVIR_3G010201v2 [Setaria viridis]TKW23792.1 hypothetical protein SEVIR_3G010201v2 [Setaria viridis]TKW23794.1 hypothetical protein SEVIR_3G010201v2 [Setaria viridis]
MSETESGAAGATTPTRLVGWGAASGLFPRALTNPFKLSDSSPPRRNSQARRSRRPLPAPAAHAFLRLRAAARVRLSPLTSALHLPRCPPRPALPFAAVAAPPPRPLPRTARRAYSRMVPGGVVGTPSSAPACHHSDAHHVFDIRSQGRPQHQIHQRFSSRVDKALDISRRIMTRQIY